MLFILGFWKDSFSPHLPVPYKLASTEGGTLYLPSPIIVIYEGILQISKFWRIAPLYTTEKGIVFSKLFSYFNRQRIPGLLSIARVKLTILQSFDPYMLPSPTGKRRIAQTGFSLFSLTNYVFHVSGNLLSSFKNLDFARPIKLYNCPYRTTFKASGNH